MFNLLFFVAFQRVFWQFAILHPRYIGLEPTLVLSQVLSSSVYMVLMQLGMQCDCRLRNLNSPLLNIAIRGRTSQEKQGHTLVTCCGFLGRFCVLFTLLLLRFPICRFQLLFWSKFWQAPHFEVCLRGQVVAPEA